MKNELIANEKAIIKGIISAFNRMETTKKDYVLSVISLGEKLIQAKEIVPHGQWEEWVKRNSEFRFDERQARKYMMVASNKSLVLEYFNDENSVNQLTKAISEATPEQIERAKQIEAERLAAEEQSKAERAAKAAQLEAKRTEETVIEKVQADIEKLQAKEPEVIEGDFEELKKPEPKFEAIKPGFVQIEAEKLEEIEDNLHELASLNRSISKDNDSMVKVFDSNDQLAAAVKEIKRLNDLNTGLEGRLNGMMNERNALIKEAKYWRAKFEKLEKKVVANG